MPAVDGLISGFDTSGLIQSITEAALQPAVTMRKRKEGLEKKMEKLAELSNLLQSVADAAGALTQQGGLASMAASASSDAVQLSLNDAVAGAGTYTVQVQQLARAETSVTAGFASADLGELQHGTLTIDYGGQTHTITVDGTNDGLGAIASAIGAIDGLDATVIDTGSGTDPFKLVVTGESGADNAIGFSFTPSGGGGAGALGFTETQAARNTIVEINGVQVESATDTVDVIPGLQMAITSMPTGPVTVRVAPDLDAMVEKVQGFVDAYNEAVEMVNLQKVYNAEAGIRGPFAGESSVRRVMDALGSMVSAQYATGGDLEALSQIGIKTERGGKLALDEDALRRALTDRYDDVEALLSSDAGPLAAIQSRIEDVFVDPDSGTLASRRESLQGTIQDLEAAIERQEAYVDDYSERLRARFTAMEAVMAQAQSTTGFLLAMLTGSTDQQA